MTASEMPAPSRYSRRLAASLVVALGLHVLLLWIPFTRWLGDRPGEVSGLGGGSRPFVGALMGTSITVRSPSPSPREADIPAQPTPTEPTAAADAAAATSPPLSVQEVDLGLDELPPITMRGSPGGSGSRPATASRVGGSLRPLEGGGNARIEMAVEPRWTKQPDPHWDLILKRKIDDEVIVQVLVDRDGFVIDSRVLRSIPRCPECTASAIDAAREWRFEQPIYEGQPVQAWVTLRFGFHPSDR
jgi:TonB family protein